MRLSGYLILFKGEKIGRFTRLYGVLGKPLTHRAPLELNSRAQHFIKEVVKLVTISVQITQLYIYVALVRFILVRGSVEAEQSI